MSHHKMQGHQRGSSRRSHRSKSTACSRTLCCTNCRISVSSSADCESSSKSNRYTSISSLAHYLVQERLDQIIKEGEEKARISMEARKRKQKGVVKNNPAAGCSNSSSNSSNNRKLLLIFAMEKFTRDPREEFRRSMFEVILANKLKQSKDLRYLLNCYISINSDEYKGIILEAFYQVCNDIFFCCKCH